ncbi:MAG: hypothetical protein OHK0029_33330 [Armatimonadaceae bacterium]
MNRLRAFTLHELLICVAVIALLMAILLPVYTQAREKSRQSSCQVSIRQVWLSMRMYVEDNNDCWPSLRAYEVWHKTHPNLQSCPIMANEPRIAGIEGYGYNTHVGQRFVPTNPAGPDTALGVEDSFIPFPATTVCLCETRAILPWQSGFFPREDKPEGAWVRHHGGANYAFVDGHVKWYTPLAVLPGDNRIGNDGQHPSFTVVPARRSIAH